MPDHTKGAPTHRPSALGQVVERYVPVVTNSCADLDEASTGECVPPGTSRLWGRRFDAC